MVVRALKNNPRSNGTLPLAGVPLLAILALAISGCSVQDRKNGQAENVRLRTPVGSLDVRTNAVHGPDVGLPVYPGAVESGRHGHDSGSDSGSADIHMSFGDWHLTVKAIEYQSGDSEDKILAFYKKAMGQYGDVLACEDKMAVGEPARTRQGLTCANDHEYDVDMKLEPSKNHGSGKAQHVAGDIKLLAGSVDDQHIVEVTPNANGTKFSIVVVQMPGKSRTD